MSEVVRMGLRKADPACAAYGGGTARADEAGAGT